MKRGVLPDWRIKELIDQGVIVGADKELVNPSSLDLRVGRDQWSLLGSTFPFPGQSVEDLLEKSGVVDFHAEEERFRVERLHPYVMKLVEGLRLPDTITARMHNKSGRARIGIALRGLADGVPQFDDIPGGYHGPLFGEVTATGFPITVNAGQTPIPQIRFYEGKPEPLTGSELELTLRDHPILVDAQGKPTYSKEDIPEIVRSGMIPFTADIPAEGLVAYVARNDKRTIDLSKTGHYRPEDFFRPERRVKGQNGVFILHPHEFALVRCRERIVLPPHLAGEIPEYDLKKFGNAQSHYAGLINAGHGHGSDPGFQSRIIFEMRARDVGLALKDGHPVAGLQVYRMWAEPEERYVSKEGFSDFELRNILPSVFDKTPRE